jgi:tetratricopeptide (TPR) repeat protein
VRSSVGVIEMGRCPASPAGMDPQLLKLLKAFQLGFPSGTTRRIWYDLVPRGCAKIRYIEHHREDLAEQTIRRALEGWEKVLGKEHPSTLTGVSNLAAVLQHQKKYKEAERMNRQTLEGRERVLGKEHPDTLISVSNLAPVLQDQGKYEDAEQMYRRALEGM